jgi:hypothetical protein
VRQAYDEFARPWRLAAGLAVIPALVVGWLFFGTITLDAFVVLAMASAAAGWVRAGAWRYFSALAILAAPLWILERGFCSWLALCERLWFGGVRYGGSVIVNAASPRRELKKWTL